MSRSAPRTRPPRLSSDSSRVSRVVAAFLSAAAPVLGCAGGPQASAERGAARPVELDPVWVDIKHAEVERRFDGARFAPWVQSADPAIRAAAALALGRIGEGAGLDMLGTLAEDPRVEVRNAALFGLGLVGDPRSEAVLIGRYRGEPEAALRAVALRGIGRVGGPAARDVLIHALGEGEPVEREAAAIAAGISAYRGRWPDGLDADVARALLTALTADDASVRRAASWALSRAKIALDVQADARLAIIGRLEDSDAFTRAAAASALGALGSGGDEGRLGKLLSDEDWQVRADAARALGRIGTDRAAAALRPALGDPHTLVRQAVIEALGQTGSAQAAPWVRTLVEDPAIGVASAAIDSLGKLEGARSLDTLARLMGAESPWVRSAALGAVADVEGPDATALLLYHAGKEIDPRVMVAVADALGRRPPSVEVDGALDALLARGDSATVAVVAGIFGDRKRLEALPDLISAWDRQRAGADFEAQIALIEAIRLIGGPESLTREFLRRVAGDPDGRVASAAAEALKALYSEEVEVLAPATRVPISASSLAEASRTHEAWIRTARGILHVELYPEVAPLTVRNFARLATSGFYSGLLWHRVVPAFVAQTGSPRGDGWGGPGYTLPDEINPTLYTPGTLGMALAGPDTGGSQFFITHGYEPHLDGTYTVFGRVIGGRDVLDSLQRNDEILSITFSPPVLPAAPPPDEAP